MTSLIPCAVFVLIFNVGCYSVAAAKVKTPNANSSQEEILRYLLDKSVYANQDPPNLDGPTVVQLGMYVNSFNSINEQNMDYALSIYLRQSWTDSRLIFDKLSGGREKIKLDVEHYNKLWVPDTFIRNEKIANFHKVTVDNRFFNLNTTDGSIWYSVKITALLACPMKLHKYPLDTQHCPLLLESFGYTRDTVILTWLPIVVDFNEEIDMPSYYRRGFTTHDCSRNYSSNKYGPCLEIQFIFEREIGYFMIQVFVPSILIVSLSWVSFWINVDAAPARVSLGLLTVLTTTSYSISINSNLPRVSYVKAIDVWMSACLLFVFCALCEYAFVNVASRHKVVLRQPIPAVRNIDRQPQLSGGSGPSGPITGPTMGPVGVPMGPPGGGVVKLPVKPVDADGKARARRIDMISRRSFPLLFFLFNIAYWITYKFIV